MTEKKIIQEYINNLRRRLARVLKPGIGLTCNVYPATTGGAVLEFIMGVGLRNDDEYIEASPSIGKALSRIEQRAFGGNLDGFNFIGTNVVLEKNRIILIKDGSPEVWSDKAAQRDLVPILQRPKSVKT